jgi:hypothetical protein
MKYIWSFGPRLGRRACPEIGGPLSHDSFSPRLLSTKSYKSIVLRRMFKWWKLLEKTTSTSATPPDVLCEAIKIAIL